MLEVFVSFPSKGVEIGYKFARLRNNGKVDVVSSSPLHFHLAGECGSTNQNDSSFGPCVAKVD